MKRLILASQSKRRSAILRDCGIPHKVVKSGVREIHLDAKRPSYLVMLNAKKKAEAVAERVQGGVVLGVDTLVLFKGRLIGKPRSEREAKKMLAAFSGSRIAVYSGVHVMDLYNGKDITGYDKTLLYIRHIPLKDVDRYFRLLGPTDKAGGFSIEGVGSIVFDDVRGSYFNVLGLPMWKLQGLFQTIGLDLLDFVRL